MKVDNFFGETLRFSKVFHPTSRRKIQRGVSTPGSHGSTFVPFSAKVEDLFYADEHTLVSFLRKHIPCSCLDKKYKEVRSTAKMSGCYNEHCSLPDRKVERSKANPCSRCRSAYYCSRECQKADVSHSLYCSYYRFVLILTIHFAAVAEA